MKKKNENPIPGIIQDCPVQHTHEFIGGKWRIGILWSLRNECRRFAQLKQDVLGISEKMLIQELRHLQRLHVIERKAYPEIPPRVEYYLTSRGKSLLPIVASIVEWGYADMAEYNTEKSFS